MFIRLLLLISISHRIKSALIDDYRKCKVDHDFPNNTLVCDEDKILTNTTIERLENALKMRQMPCQCAEKRFCIDILHGLSNDYKMAMIVILSNEHDLANTMKKIYYDVRFGREECNNGMLTLYVRDTDQIATYHGLNSYHVLNEEERNVLRTMTKGLNDKDEELIHFFKTETLRNRERDDGQSVRRTEVKDNKEEAEGQEQGASENEASRRQEELEKQRRERMETRNSDRKTIVAIIIGILITILTLCCLLTALCACLSILCKSKPKTTDHQTNRMEKTPNSKTKGVDSDKLEVTSSEKSGKNVKVEPIKDETSSVTLEAEYGAPTTWNVGRTENGSMNANVKIYENVPIHVNAGKNESTNVNVGRNDNSPKNWNEPTNSKPYETMEDAISPPFVDPQRTLEVQGKDIIF